MFSDRRILTGLLLLAATISAGAQPAENPSTSACALALDEADSLLDQGHYTEADSVLLHWSPHVEAAFGTPSEEVGDLIAMTAEATWRLGRLAAADSLFRVAIEMRAQVHGERSVEVATAMRLLAGVQNSTNGGLDDAIATAREAITIFEERRGPEDPEIALALTTIAISLARQGHYAEARPEFERIYQLLLTAHGEIDTRVADAQQNLGSIYYVLGDYESARIEYQESYEIYRQTLDPSSARFASIALNLGNVQSLAGDFAQALESYLEAGAIRERTVGTDNASMLTVSLGLGNLYLQLADHEAAEEHLNHALTLATKLHGEESAEVGNILTHLGGLADRRGNIDLAEELFERSLANREKALGPDHDFTAHSMINLAQLLRRQGKLERARELVDRTLAVRIKNNGEDSWRVAETRSVLATIEYDEGNHDAAREQLEFAVVAFRDGLPTTPAYAKACAKLAVAREATGDPTGAIEMFLAAADVHDQSLRRTATVLSEQQALSYQQDREQSLDRLVAACLRLDPDGELVEGAWERVATSRGLVLDEMARRLQVLHAHPDTLTRALFADLASVDERLSNLYMRPQSQMSARSYENALNSLSQRKETLEQKLAQQIGPEYAVAKDATIGTSALRAELGSGQALVSFARAQAESEPARLSAFVMTSGNSEVDLVDLGPIAAVDSLVATWLDVARQPIAGPGAARRGEARLRELGEELRERLLDPVLEICGSERDLLLVPTGTLHLVPWLALPNEADGYLVESDRVIEVMNTERELLRSPANAGVGLLALGDPDFAALPSSPEGMVVATRGSRRPCVESQLSGLTALPGARREVEDLVEQWAQWRSSGQVEGEQSARLGPEATEDAIRRDSRGRRVVHVATHGFFLATPCENRAEDSTRSLGRVELDPVRRQVAATNPLLLSGLALAGADAASTTARNDGIFTAEEMSTLDLEGVEWFVLSGCDTGQGTIESSEGVFGMRRALSLAGARTVIMSLWPVDDSTARQWMGELYRARFAVGLSTPRAVRAASLTLLQQRRERGLGTHPATWAPFQASGR